MLFKASSSKFEGNFGNPPASLLKLRSILLKLDIEFIFFGRDPVKELREMSSDSSDLRVVIEEGSSPSKELDLNDRVWRLEREEIVEGIDP